MVTGRNTFRLLLYNRPDINGSVQMDRGDRTGNSWMMVGAGPSAGRWSVPDDIRVGTCNASHMIVSHPTVYGVFELTAGAKLGRTIKRMLSDGEPVVYLRPRSRDRSGLSDTSRAVIIDTNWGPRSLVDLHQDVQWADEDEGVPEYGQHIAWISSGVLMLWIIADIYRPDTIYVTGLDGYPIRMDDKYDYAQGLPNLAPPGLDIMGTERRWQMNKRMAEGIERITQFYTGTEFVWIEKPAHYRESWRARIANADDLCRLYPAVVATSE